MQYFVYGVIGVVVVAVVAGVVLVGSPVSERARQFDSRRVSDLQSIQWQVVNYWQAKEELPANLSLLEGGVSSFMVPRDPETDAAYAYAVTASTSFSLCATFSAPSGGEGADIGRPIPSSVYIDKSGFGTVNWEHGAGYVCFERTIDPDLYPPFNDGVPRASGGCVITGCSGQVCADEEIITTCEWTPRYACYKQYSRCERSAEGLCGWAPTPELMQCLSETRAALSEPVLQ